MYLKQLKLVVSAALPSLITSQKAEILEIFEVNGAAIEASASDKETPT